MTSTKYENEYQNICVFKCKVQVSSFISFILPISCTLTNVRRFNNQ